MNFNETFRQSDVKELFEYEQAEKKMEDSCNFWSGVDFSVENDQIIPPRKWLDDINIVLNKDNFPPIEINKGSLQVLKHSVRSRYAQAGIEIRISPNDFSSDAIENIAKGRNAVVPVTVGNFSLRPVELHGEVMRFFWVNENKRLKGKELRDTLSKELKIDGEYEKDWEFGDADFKTEEDLELLRLNSAMNPNFSKDIKDLFITLKLTGKKMYIPESDKPLRISKRSDLEEALKEMPPGPDLDFEIGETPKIHLSDNIVGVINIGLHENSKRHLLSPLIDPGFEGPIRTECFNNLEKIDIFFYPIKPHQNDK